MSCSVPPIATDPLTVTRSEVVASTRFIASVELASNEVSRGGQSAAGGLYHAAHSRECPDRIQLAIEVKRPAGINSDRCCVTDLVGEHFADRSPIDDEIAGHACAARLSKIEESAVDGCRTSKRVGAAQDQCARAAFGQAAGSAQRESQRRTADLRCRR